MTVADAGERYHALAGSPLASTFDLLATSPNGVASLRELILSMAVKGTLVQQDTSEEPASTLLDRIYGSPSRVLNYASELDDGVCDGRKSSVLPPGWSWTTVGQYFEDLCTGPFGSLISKNEYVQSGVPLVNPSHMINGEIVPEMNVSVSADKARELSAYRLRTGDMVFARRGEVGRNAVVTIKENGWLCGTGSFFARLHPDINRKYLRLIFETCEMRQRLAGEAIGSTMVNLNQKILLATPLRIPPLAEQLRISARVEKLMKLCDALEVNGRLEAEQHARLVSTLFDTLAASESPQALTQNWQRIAQHFDLLLDRPEAVETLEQTVLQLAVRGFLVLQDPREEPAAVLLDKIRRARTHASGGYDSLGREKDGEITGDVLPLGWARSTVGEYFDALCTGPFGSLISKNEYVSNGVPLVNPSHMVGGKIAPDLEVCVSAEKARELSAYRLRTGDMVFARRGEVGRNAIVTANENGWLCGTGSFFARLHSDIDRDYLRLIFETRDMRRHLAGEAVGSTMVNLNQKILMATSLLIPPLAEQHRIVARVKGLGELCAQLRERLTAKSNTQARLAEAIVQSVV